MRIVLAGVSHRTAPLEVRERLAVEDPAPLLQKLVGCDEIDEAVLLSTCNRVEIVALTRNPEAARHRVRSFFRRDLGGGDAVGHGGDVSDLLYEYADGEAMRHVMRVASSLDSMVVGEPQILGQTKEAYRAAADCGACGPILGRLYQQAFATAKRVRTETRVAEGTLSVARVAVDLAGQIFESLEDKDALLVGAGEVIEAALVALRSDGLRGARVANRTPERAAELAARFDATAHGLDELPALLRKSDVVVTSIAGGRPVLDAAMVEAALRERPSHPLFLIDLGVPRNIEPAVDQLANAYLYDIDDLGAVTAGNAEERRRETARAEAIAVEEQQRFDGWFAALRAVPTIRHLRTRVESIRAAEVERTLGRLDLADPERESVEELTRRVVNKILHAPLSRLRSEAQREEGMAVLEVARVLFGLDDPPGDEEEPPESAEDESSVVRIATRASDLALVQARAVAHSLEAALGVTTELVPLKTTGDRLVHVPLSEVGGKGLFVKEVEEALLGGLADLAVHSAKDLPAALPPELELVAFPERADPRDALVGEAGVTLASLRRGARVGTGSARRTALLRLRRPDLEIAPLRGNVPTRLGRVDTGEVDAVVLACAGLDRLGRADRIVERLSPQDLLPAVAQGSLAIEGRRGDPVARDAAVLCHASTRTRVLAERAFLAGLEGDCNVPLAALAEESAPGQLRLRGLVATLDGRRVARAESVAPVAEAEDLGARVARAVREDGGEEILAALRAGARA